MGDAHQEVRVVDVKLHGVKQILHPLQLSIGTVDHVLVPPSDNNLQGGSNRSGDFPRRVPPARNWLWDTVGAATPDPPSQTRVSPLRW